MKSEGRLVLGALQAGLLGLEGGSAAIGSLLLSEAAGGAATSAGEGSELLEERHYGAVFGLVSAMRLFRLLYQGNFAERSFVRTRASLFWIGRKHAS